MILIHRSKLLILSSKPLETRCEKTHIKQAQLTIEDNCLQILKKTVMSMQCIYSAQLHGKIRNVSGSWKKPVFRLEWSGLVEEVTNCWGYSALVTTELCMHQFLGRRLKFSLESDSNLRVNTELFICLPNLYFIMQIGCLVV